MSRNRLAAAVDQLETSRRYTKQFLSDLAPEEWFWHPHGFVTHVAWQVGHLAYVEYGLCLRRVRGRTAADESLISDAFIQPFQKGSTPQAGAERYPSLGEIQHVLDAVHAQTLAELTERSDEELDVPTDPPHPVFKTKLGAVAWCPLHELVHAGQIALLRRLMGKPPLR
jgi:uncharacterized damage-inducible protein DinB